VSDNLASMAVPETSRTLESDAQTGQSLRLCR
jgi:hypothetical protein